MKQQLSPEMYEGFMDQLKAVAEAGNYSIPRLVKPAAVFDIDGTLRPLPDRSTTPWTFATEPFEEVEEKLWQLKNEQGHLIFAISNQAGVAYGFHAMYEVHSMLDKFLACFEKNPFDSVRVCYSHPGGNTHPFNYRSLLRKPDIGMLALCEADAFNKGYVVDWDNSFMVGDRFEDRELTVKAGIKFHWAWDYFERELIIDKTISPDVAETLKQEWDPWEASDRKDYGHK